MLGAVQIASAAEAIATGQAASPQVVRNCRRMLDDNPDQNVVFTAQLQLKDVNYGLLLARTFEIGNPFGSLAGAAFGHLCKMGHAHDNESAILEVARSQAPN